MNIKVSFQIAKLLKERGFDESTTPTISDTVMWLKEKHGVWIFAETDCYGENWYGKISICSKDV